MDQRDFRLLIFGMLGVAACTVLWLAAIGAFGAPPGDFFSPQVLSMSEGRRSGWSPACLQ